VVLGREVLDGLARTRVEVGEEDNADTGVDHCLGLGFLRRRAAVGVVDDAVQLVLDALGVDFVRVGRDPPGRGGRVRQEDADLVVDGWGSSALGRAAATGNNGNQ